ncbi:MAG: CBS domain-containing protein [Thermodesulfobacteriota bacterium]|nr:CBS domain-containing protein [Thermodesulfobacteriota bacterium]
MYVRDIMTTNVVTVPSKTSIADAKRIMQAHKFRRLPVVDKGKLVGMVTEHKLESVAPSKATSLTVWEIGYLLEKSTVKEIMEKDVITVHPDMTVEKAVAIAQAKKIGALLVMDNGRVEGIVTTNDFFYKIVNKVLGIGEPGARIEVSGAGEGKALQEVISCINKHGLRIMTLHVDTPPDKGKNDLIVHVDSEDVRKVIEELKEKGYSATIRTR